MVAIALTLGGGLLLLNRADAQMRDTTRKHHLQDIEQSLYFAKGLHGTFPPYAEPTWCGLLSNPVNRPVRDQIEAALRQQNNTYANPEKTFPRDPLPEYDYFYWKRSPATFELYAMLEQDNNNERNSLGCPTASDIYYDYGLNSHWRRNMSFLKS